MIHRMELDVSICVTGPYVQIAADWKMYELILFNIIQNAVKYNVFKGEIIFIIKVFPVNCEGVDHYVLETEILDTGVGISEERQRMLFVPFLELKLKQNMNMVEDSSIGMGLACSSSIARALGGDIKL